MTIHYHGTPITPKSVLMELTGFHFCVSFAAPRDVGRCHEIGQSVMLDNGAFSIWRKNQADKRPAEWEAYYAWIEPWLKYHTTWAVIPDTITGNEDENDLLIYLWPFGKSGAPVWHMHESLDRLKGLCATWPKVCIGSSGDYRSVGTKAWNKRMNDAMQYICGIDGETPAWLHMLRGMNQVNNIFPFASVDSTDVARNWHLKGNALAMIRRWDAIQCPSTYALGEEEQLELFAQAVMDNH